MTLLAQAPERSDQSYIEKVFQSQIGEVPRLGWFDPLGGFIAEVSQPDLTDYSPLGMSKTVRRKGAVPTDHLKFARDRFRLVCEVEDEGKLTRYEDEVAGEPDPVRALYTTKPLKGEVRAGLVSVSLGGEALTAVARSLGWPGQGVLRRDEAIAVRPGSPYYSIHRLYNTTNALMQKEVTFLHGTDGRILGQRVSVDIDKGQPCDGCGMTSFAYQGSAAMSVLNMFELPGFKFPLLLLDTSTDEGRALSLFTFTPDGKPAEYRIYEYVVHCP